MPVAIKAHACKFRCGFVRVKEQPVLWHEPRCTKNPARRGCATCGNKGEDGDDYRTWLTCEADARGEPTVKNPDGLRFDCEAWTKAKG